MNKGVVGSVVGATLVVAVLAISGCGGGGGGGEGASTAAALSKSEYVKEANAICKKSLQEREADANEVAEEIKPGANAGELSKKQLVEAITPSLASMVNELAALPAPSGDESRVEAMMEAYEKGLEEVEENGEAAFSSEPFKTADEKAMKYGLKDCVL